MVAVLVVFTGPELVAQNDMLPGNWLVNVDKSVERMPEEIRTHYNSLDASGQARAKAVMSGRVFRFHEDSTVYITWNVGEQVQESSGTWSQDADAAIVTITIDGNPREFEYSFEAGALQLKNRQGGGFLNTLCFTRQ